MLSTTAEYALRIMIVMAESDEEVVASHRISESTHIPLDYTHKILQWLGRAGLVRSRRGRGGGYRLACDPEKTSLLDVVNVIDPLQRITTCPLDRTAHQTELCPLHSRLDQMMAMLESSLQDMTLASVVEGQAGPTLCELPGVRVRVTDGKRGASRGASSGRRQGRT